MTTFKEIYQNGRNVYKNHGSDGFYMGDNPDSPQFEVSFDTSAKSKNNSSATVSFKIYKDNTSGELTYQDIADMKSLAYQILRDNNRLYINLPGDYRIGEVSRQLTLDTISIQPIAGTDVWNVTAKYKEGEGNEQTDQEMALKNFNFSTQGKTAHIIQSLMTVNRYPVAGYTQAYDFNCGIGYQDGEFAGVDIKRPNLVFQRDMWILEENLTWEHVRALAEFTGSVNSDRFYGFDPGQVLFAGVSQGQRATMKIGDATLRYWQIGLAFEVAPNEVTYWNGNIVSKRGWDYAWVLSMKTVMSGDAGQIVGRTPLQMNIEQVYPYKEFCAFFGFGFNGWKLIDNEGFDG